jgi:hypothetical protein
MEMKNPLYLTTGGLGNIGSILKDQIKRRYVKLIALGFIGILTASLITDYFLKKRRGPPEVV